MSIVKITDKRIGVTYVYDQQKGVWDSEKQQMRSKRTLIGKVDPETGETVPTKGWGKNRSSVQKKKTGKNESSVLLVGNIPGRCSGGIPLQQEDD